MTRISFHCGETTRTITRVTRVANVLFVDDEQTLRSAFARIFSSVPAIHVMTAADGASGMGLIAGHSFDVVVSDYSMPGIRGDRVLQEAALLQPAARRIMLTGSPIEGRVQAHLLMEKPFDVTMLRTAIMTAVECDVDAFCAWASAATT